MIPQDPYWPILREVRRLAARLEALGCGWQPADGTDAAGTAAAHRDLIDRVESIRIGVRDLPVAERREP